MRTSCNGCRVLRKGCNDDCAIRPSLDWITSPDSQANATVFLAKFYGRAGLLNLLSAAPSNLRPATFKSLLYEACGRIVDPVYGSVGLMYSGQWHHCQAAVDAVLKGLPILQLPTDHLGPTPPAAGGGDHIKLCDIRHVSSRRYGSVQRTRARSKVVNGKHVEEGDDHEDESMFSNETVEPTMANQAEPAADEPGLELTLGMPQYRPSWL